MNHLLSATLIAFAYIAWPILGKYSGVTGMWVSTVVAFGTFSTIFALSAKNLVMMPDLRALIILGGAGIVNGVAVYFYAIRASDPRVSTATFVVTVSVLMVVLAPLFNWALNGDAPSVRHGLGFACAGVAIYLLR